MCPVYMSPSCCCCCCCCRYAELRERLEGCRHEGEMVRARMEQSSHHQQLTQLQQLSDSMGEGVGV